MNDGGVASLDLKSLKVISPLGRGAKGVVFLVQSGRESVALKAISRASIEKNKDAKNSDGSDYYRRIFFEQQVLSCFQHPLFPKLRGVVVTEKIVGYAIDYCPGRDLNSLRKKQIEKTFSDDVIRFYAAELVLALEYLHGLGIVYRDLKPENVMVQENGHLMLVDFDLSTKLAVRTPETPPITITVTKPVPMNKKKKKHRFNVLRRFYSGMSPEDTSPASEQSVSPVASESESVFRSNSFVGTEEYLPPEMIRGNGHDFTVDWWCLGIVLYEMLYGVTPFRGSNRKETYYRILTKSPDLLGEPTALRDLIGTLLEKDPKQRITVEGIKAHPFFRGMDWDLVLRISRPPFIPQGGGYEDTKGNKEIDVEEFVQGIFKVGGDDDENNKKNSENKAEKENPATGNGQLVKELDHPARQNDNFFIF